MAQRRTLAVLVVAAALTAACGTTVPTAQQGVQPQAPGDAGLGAPAAPGSTLAPAGTTGDGTASLAGGQGSTGGSGTTGTTGGQTGTVPSGQGTTGTAVAGSSTGRVTAPLQIGLVYNDNSGTEAALGATSTDINAKQAAQALVRGINAKGGLAGRKLQAIEYSWNTQDTDYATDAATACAKFTEDNHVSVVLDGGFGTAGGFRDCLQKHGVLDITQAVEDDRVGSSRAPLHDNTFSMTPDRSYSATLNGLTATGYLTKKSQFGVLVEQCPHLLRAYDNTIKPLIARLGMKAPLVRTIECTTGFASAGNDAAPVSSAVLAFRQGGVDRVMFVSDYETVALLLFANAASSQSYQPGYALTTNAQAEYVRQNISDNRQWAGLNGVGWAPSFDVADAHVAPTASERRCLEIVKAGGLQAPDYLSQGIVYGACSTFLLLEAALLRTNGASTPAVLQSAINGIGSGFEAPGIIGGGTTFSSSRHDGADMARVFGYDANRQVVAYRGGIRRVPA